MELARAAEPTFLRQKQVDICSTQRIEIIGKRINEVVKKKPFLVVGDEDQKISVYSL